MHLNGDVSRFPWMLFKKNSALYKFFWGEEGGHNKKMLLAFEVKLHFFQDFKAPVNLKVDGVVYFAIATIYEKGNLNWLKENLPRLICGLAFARCKDICTTRMKNRSRIFLLFTVFSAILRCKNSKKKLFKPLVSFHTYT